MRVGPIVSRRNAVTLVAGTLAASAAPASSPLAARALSAAAPGATVEQSRRRMLALLRDVRRARIGAGRAAAFERFATALRVHAGVAAFEADVQGYGEAARADRSTALYRQRKPEIVLANVIARELLARPQSDAAWMTRFAELEAVIRAETA